MDDDMLPASAEELIEGEPDIPAEAPRTTRAFPVEDVWREGDRYLGVRVPVDDEYRRAYQRPGQYVTLSPEQLEPRFLVIASAPGADPEGTWEFLVDRKTELGTSIDPLEPGADLEISPPEGPGYPADDVADNDVLCFTTGSGIASVRPAIEYWHDQDELAPHSISVYYGETRSGDFAYTERVSEWSRRGVEVFFCYEDGGDVSSEFRYVQHAFDHHAPSLEDAVVFLAGAPVMKRHVVDILAERGISLERIFTNV